MQQRISLTNWSWCLILSSQVLVAAEKPLTERSSPTIKAPESSASRSRFRLTAAPSALEITQAQFFDEPLIPSREPSLSENQALVVALERFAQRAVRDDFSSPAEFLEHNPDSAWAMALETQLGSEYYRVGRYSKAIDAWQHVWESGKTASL